MDAPRLDFLTAMESDGKTFVTAAALKEFHTASTDYIRFKTFYYDLVKSKSLPHDKTKEPKRITKNAVKSVELRVKGDNAVLANDLQEALICYTQSIATAPYPTSETDVSTELAMAFGERSAVYVKLKKYEAALQDIAEALSFQYPDHLKYNILTRRFRCLFELDKLEEAEECLDEAGHCIHLSHQSESRCHLLLKTNKLKLCTTYFKKMLQKEQNCGKDEEMEKVTVHERPPLTKTYGEHKEIPAASNCLRIKFNNKFGRHLVSTREIHPGDILIMEEPYVATLLPDCYDTHCYNCLKRSEAMIPCKYCSLVKFCSGECRNLAWAGYHDIECPILPYFNDLEIDYIPPLTLRMLITATKTIGDNSLQTLFDKVKFLEENDMFFGAKTGFNKDLKYLSSNYMATHLLYRNSIHRLYKESNLNISYYLVAAIVVNCLEEYTDFFLPPITPETPPPAEPEVEWKIFIGSIFTLYASIVSTNGFSVSEHQHDLHTKDSKVVRIGSGVYNTLALLNHSCFNNVQTFVTNGKTQVLIAIRPIKKGDQLFTNYGYFYITQSLHERKAELKYHFFTCECEACVDNWPTEDKLLFERPVVVCAGCRQSLPLRQKGQAVRCSKCKVKNDLGSLQRRLREIMERVPEIKEEMFTPEGLEKDFTKELSEYMTFVCRHFKIPLIPMLVVEDALMENFRRTGNHHVHSTEPLVPVEEATEIEVCERER